MDDISANTGYAPKKLFEFITEGEGISYDVIQILDVGVYPALIKYCKYAGMQGIHLEAICAVGFKSAIQLANEWLSDPIVNIHEVGYTVFDRDNEIEILSSNSMEESNETTTS